MQSALVSSDIKIFELEQINNCGLTLIWHPPAISVSDPISTIHV